MRLRVSPKQSVGVLEDWISSTPPLQHSSTPAHPFSSGSARLRLGITALLLCGILVGCGKGGPDTSNPRFKAAMDKLAAANSPQLRFYALGGAATQSFVAGKVEDARKYAQELLDLLPGFRQDGEYGNAVHEANLTLGRIAVREGRIEDAKRYLIESVRTPGARQMDYGPSMSLAKDLLDKGERQAVLEYFALCKKFWNNGRLEEWSRQVKEGKIPDFGRNLAD
jgi:hypothetical protein